MVLPKKNPKSSMFGEGLHKPKHSPVCLYAIKLGISLSSCIAIATSVKSHTDLTDIPQDSPCRLRILYCFIYIFIYY